MSELIPPEGDKDVIEDDEDGEDTFDGPEDAAVDESLSMPQQKKLKVIVCL